MQLKRIVTERMHQTHFAMQIVYEWEDIICEKINIELEYESYFRSIFNKLIQKLGLSISPHSLFKQHSLRIELIAKLKEDLYNNKNIVPWVVDFYLTKDKLKLFEEAHKNNPFILISSKEADIFLTENNFPIKHYHLPLSLPDKYKLNNDTNEHKDIDLVMMGRPNPMLEKWLQVYTEKYPDFSYILRQNKNGKLKYYDNKGNCMGFPDTREEYFKLLKRAKISFYSTPGIDGGEKYTNGFNQITPRLLEILSCGCHVIARWKDNPDSDYYQLHSICENIQDYPDFERLMNTYRIEKVDYSKYSAYLKEHYTSTIIQKMVDILQTI